MSEQEVIEGDAVEEPEALSEPAAETIRSNLPAVRASEALVTRSEISVDELIAQRDKVKEVMLRAMDKDVHYGVIPGTGSKPTLLKPGAETLCVMLRLAPHYHSDQTFHEDGHLTVSSRVTLQHIPTGLTVSEGEGLCTSREAKYAFRKGERVCPACGQPTIIKGKAEYGGGWLCWNRKGGCGAKFSDGDATIEGQNVEKVANPDLADSFNTVLKMANKRALIAAVLNGTAASDIFTQDLEDQPKPEAVVAAPAAAHEQRTPPAGGAAAKNARPLSEAQQKKIHVLKAKVIDPTFTDEQWREWLQKEFQVASTTELSSQAASRLIERLVEAEKKQAAA